MDYFELVEISTQHLELTSPAAPEKLWTIGHYLGLNSEKRVIDFGCGYGQALTLWAEDFGISGVGVDIHQFLCKRATERVAARALTELVEIVCSNAADYEFEAHSFDIASCLGASFIWGGYRQAIRKMKIALCSGGKIVVGEPYYTHGKIPSKLIKYEGDLHTEFELMQITREEGFEIEFVVRASGDDWDRYVSSSWYGLLRWIDENPDHIERQYVIDYLHKSQDMYLKYQRKYEGWALYILNPREYLGFSEK